MKRLFFLAAVSLLFTGVPRLLCEENAAVLRPRVLADFKEGEPALSVAPGEKRLVRTWRAGGKAFNKPPYDAFPGKRISLKETIEQDAGGNLVLVPKSDMTASVLGGMNMGMGTLAGWFRKGEIFREKAGPFLSAKSYSTGYAQGITHWWLGVEDSGNICVTTPGTKCVAKDALSPDGDWVHIAAVWDENHGAKIYLDGKLAGNAWRQGQAETAEPIFSTGQDTRLFMESRFSLGAGARSFASLPEAGIWDQGSVLLRDAPEGPELEIVNKSAERLQMRTRPLTRLEPGSYEVIISLRASGDAKWQPRISVRSDDGTRFIGFSLKTAQSEEATASVFRFEIDKEAQVSLDLNFYGPARYGIREILIRRAGDMAGTGKLSTVDNPVPADRLHIHADPQGGIRDLQIFDVALSAEGVNALYKGETPRGEMTEPFKTDHSFRLSSLGWIGAPDAAFLSVAPGRTRILRQAPVLEAKENLRAAGWQAVSGFVDEVFPWKYHGYSQGVDKELRLVFGENIVPNWITGSGDFTGWIQTASGEPQPFQTSGPWFGKSIEPEASETELILTQKSGTLSNLSFYEVSENGADFPEGGQIYSLRETGESVPLPEWKEREFYSVYTPGNRLMFEAQSTQTPAATRKIPALTAWHIVSPPMSGDYFLGKIGLRFRTTPLSEKTRTRVVIHDAFSPWRELARVDFLLEPSAKGQSHAILCDLRDTLIAKEDALWLTVTFDREVELHTGAGGTELALFPAEDKDKALALWRDWELRSVRDRFELLSEPRPWGRVGEDEESRWWLAAAMPAFEQLDRSLNVLRERFPDDPAIRAWYYFTHPQAQAPVSDVPLPEKGEHPEWAVLARECLRLYRQFVDFWIDQRQHANGEFGNFYGDDTDLVQDWLDLTLITDPQGKYAESLHRLARGISTAFTQLGGRDGPDGRHIKGRPLLENGLNLRWTDTLHAYEDGLNVQPPDFIAHYGDPAKFQHLLDTVSRYDGFLLTPEINGVRRFASKGSGGAYINTKEISGDSDDKYWHLFLYAGLVAAWYNNDPEIWSMLEAVARSNTAAPLLQAVFSKTGNMDYLAPHMDSGAWKENRVLTSPGDALYPNTYMRVAEMNQKLTFERMAQNASGRYASLLGSDSLGWNDNRHLKNWLEWRLTGDESHLLDGLRALYRQLVFLMPAYTTAEQSGDRVSIPKQLISQLYLGGIPGSRNRHFYPDFAVSYRGLNDNFAARVLENTPQSVRVQLYSFDEKPVSGEVLVWALEPGEYKITQGAEGGDAEPTITRQFLKRGESFPVTLPPRTPWLVTVEQESRAEESAVLGDAAVSAESIRWENGVLRVPVYNLGVAPLENVNVRLFSKGGKLIGEKTIGTLPGVKNWKLGVSELQFEIQPETEIHVEVNGPTEISRQNNRVVFHFTEAK